MTPTPASTLELLHAIDLYFQGEKLEALVFILPVGLLSLVLGVWLFSDGSSSSTRAVAIPFLAMGLVMSAVGGAAPTSTTCRSTATRPTPIPPRTPSAWASTSRAWRRASAWAATSV